MLRARTPDDVERRSTPCSAPTKYYAPRWSTHRQPTGLDPDRASFTTALKSAADQIVNAAGVIAGTVIDLVGVIGTHVPNNLLPDRRIRVKSRMIKRIVSARPGTPLMRGG